MKEIEALEAKSSNWVIKFTPDQYKRLVIQNPRPYDVVMLYNVDKSCDHCIMAQKEYEQLTYSFI